MAKIDLKAQLKHLYFPSAKEPTIVEVPKMNFLMIDGRGDPNTAPVFQQAIQVLYSLSYTMKFMLKQEKGGPDSVVMPLEGLWWSDDMGHFAGDTKKDLWQWTAMIAQVDFVTPDLIEQARAELKAKKKDLPGLDLARLEVYDEGKAAQIMHIGPYSGERPAIARLHDFIKSQGCRLRGKHHEIYMSDPRRVAPEKLKTVIRQPIE